MPLIRWSFSTVVLFFHARAKSVSPACTRYWPAGTALGSTGVLIFVLRAEWVPQLVRMRHANKILTNRQGLPFLVARIGISFMHIRHFYADLYL